MHIKMAKCIPSGGLGQSFRGVAPQTFAKMGLTQQPCHGGAETGAKGAARPGEPPASLFAAAPPADASGSARLWWQRGHVQAQ